MAIAPGYSTMSRKSDGSLVIHAEGPYVEAAYAVSAEDKPRCMAALQAIDDRTSAGWRVRTGVATPADVRAFLEGEGIEYTTEFAWFDPDA